MFESMHIRHFESHKDTSLDFHEGVNVLIGPTDAGKSSVIRALELVINNEPAGDSYRSWGSKVSRVDLKVDGVTVRRKRGNTVNSYRVGKKVLKAFGRAVPEAVSKLLNVGSINWQRQFDKAFLLSLPPPEVARQLDDIVNLDIIDHALSNAHKAIHSTKSDLKSKKEDLKELQGKAKSFSYLKNMERDLKRLETLQNKERELERQKDELDDLWGKIRLKKRELKKLTIKLPSKKRIDSLLTLLKQRRQLEREKQLLEDYLSELLELKKQIKSKREKVETLKKQMPKVCPTCKRPI